MAAWSRAIVRRSGGSVALRMGELLGRGLDGAVGHDALAQAGEHLSGPDLDEAARAGLSLCKFAPATVGGRPERAWARLEYSWTLKDQ